MKFILVNGQSKIIIHELPPALKEAGFLLVYL